MANSSTIYFDVLAFVQLLIYTNTYLHQFVVHYLQIQLLHGHSFNQAANRHMVIIILTNFHMIVS